MTTAGSSEETKGGVSPTDIDVQIEGTQEEIENAILAAIQQKLDLISSYETANEQLNYTKNDLYDERIKLLEELETEALENFKAIKESYQKIGDDFKKLLEECSQGD